MLHAVPLRLASYGKLDMQHEWRETGSAQKVLWWKLF